MPTTRATAGRRGSALPGRRERGERWSASGVRMWIAGRSQVPDAIQRLLPRVTAVLGGLVLALGLGTWIPDPEPPAVLACTGDLRWFEPCHTLGPDLSREAVSPMELSRRLTAAWDYGPDSELWRAGGVPYDQAQRARWLRDAELTDGVRGRAAAQLATTLTLPDPYGGWETGDADPDLIVTAEAIEEAFRQEADAAWRAHLAQARIDHGNALAAQASWQEPLRRAFPWIGSSWLLAALALGLTRLARWRAERPFEVRIGPHELILDGTGIPTAALERVEVRWGRLELGLRDGSRWVSRPLRPRNPARLELLVMRSLRSPKDYGAESNARQEVHEALAAVLSRVGG